MDSWATKYYARNPHPPTDCVNINKSFINDDYCDCQNGKDEPGTSACLNASFMCENKGHLPLKLNSNRVNDAVCDCCDGSDEFDGYMKCPNTCREEALLYNKERQHEFDMIGKAVKVKKGLEEFGGIEKKKIELEMGELEGKLVGVNGDIDSFMKVKVSAQLKFDKLQHARNKTLALKRSKECLQNLVETKKTLSSQKETISKLREELDKLFNSISPILPPPTDDKHHVDYDDDDEEKDHQKEFDPYQEVNDIKRKNDNIQQKPSDESSKLSEACSKDPLIESISLKIRTEEIKSLLEKTAKKNENNNDKNDDEEGDQIALLSDQAAAVLQEDPCLDDNISFFDCISHGFGSAVDRGLDVFGWSGWSRIFGPAKKLMGWTEVVSDEQEKQRVDARNALKEVEKKLESVEAEKDKITKSLESLKEKNDVDLGPNNVFAKFYKQCIELDSPEYTYEICFFGSATQKSKNGGSSTSIGNFKRWGNRKEVISSKYFGMMFENGEKCWNGPERSLEVLIECGLENKAFSVSEPSKCEYSMKITSPAVCQKDPSMKDEL